MSVRRATLSASVIAKRLERDRGGARRGCAGRLPGCRACEPRTDSATAVAAGIPALRGGGGCQRGTVRIGEDLFIPREGPVRLLTVHGFVIAAAVAGAPELPPGRSPGSGRTKGIIDV